MPVPNDHGVYCEGAWTEHIHHKTESGAVLDIYLVETDDGWRWGCDYALQWAGGGGWPSILDTPLSTRQEAIDAAVSRLRGIADRPHYHDPSVLELRQRSDVLTWCGSRKQMELFA